MKKNFALRVDAEIYEAIEKWAAEEFRSANGQIEWILHAALKKAGRLPKKKDVRRETLDVRRETLDVRRETSDVNL